MKIKRNFFNIKYVTINKANVGRYHFLSPDMIRKARDPKVKSLTRHYQNGNNTDAPLITIARNRTDSDVGDGQHRLLAILQCIDQDPTFEIEQTVFEYPSMTQAQLGDLFKNWNGGTPQSTDDFIQMFSRTIPIYNMMDQPTFTNFLGVPVNIYPVSGELHFRKWMGAYSAALKNTIGGNSETNERFVNTLRSLNQSDLSVFQTLVKDIYTNLPEIFDRGYRYASSTGVNALVYVYYHLVSMGFISKTEFWKIYNAHVSNNDVYRASCKMTGGAASREATKILIGLMNTGRTKANKLTIPHFR